MAKASADPKEQEISYACRCRTTSVPARRRSLRTLSRRAASCWTPSPCRRRRDDRPRAARRRRHQRPPCRRPAVEGEAPTLAELARRGALERHLRVDLDAKRLTVDIAFTLDHILCWLRSLCAVNGTVIKRTTLDGQNIDLPVCDATVEVYEVDPFYIILPKLPKSVLDRLRDIILHPIPLPDPIPDPLPGPFPGPFPPEPGPGPDPFFARVRVRDPEEVRAGGRGQLPISAQRLISTQVVTRLVADRAPEATAALANVASASALQFAARTASDLEFRRVLLDHERLVRPIFCLFYPHFFSLQLVATTEDRRLRPLSHAVLPGLQQPGHARPLLQGQAALPQPVRHHDLRADPGALLHVVELCLRHRGHPRHPSSARTDLPALPAGRGR